MDKLSLEQLNRKTLLEFKQSAKYPVIVVLDNIRSLHNIGSIFRSADAFLIEAIFLCGISATPPHPEIHKSALGAEHTVAWEYFPETAQALASLRSRGFRVFAVEQTTRSTPLNQFMLPEGTPCALIFGNEVKGVQQTIIDQCDGSIEIPQFGTKHSFNVSVTAGIVLWEIYKQMDSTRYKVQGTK